jgi:DNA-binding HxlR family transcriptional regulator
MPTKRSYNDGCAVAHALDLFSERWTLLLVRTGARPQALHRPPQAGLPGISASAPTQRLKELERTSIVRRRKLPPPASA